MAMKTLSTRRPQIASPAVTQICGDPGEKTALQLVRAYDVIYLEDLRANLVQNSKLAKSITDAGWAQFRTILEGKAAYAGRPFLRETHGNLYSCAKLRLFPTIL